MALTPQELNDFYESLVTFISTNYKTHIPESVTKEKLKLWLMQASNNHQLIVDLDAKGFAGFLYFTYDDEPDNVHVAHCLALTTDSLRRMTSQLNTMYASSSLTYRRKGIRREFDRNKISRLLDLLLKSNDLVLTT